MIDINSLTPEKLAGMIDHTLLKAYVTRDDLKDLCDTAMRYHFRSVAINGAQVPFCSEYLKGSGVLQYMAGPPRTALPARWRSTRRSSY